jgi:hypothetical protein
MTGGGRRGRAWRGLFMAFATASVVAMPATTPAQQRRGTRDEAIRICSNEMSRRFGGARVRVERVHRVSRRGDRLSVHARMRAERFGNDVTRDVDCAVDFSRRPRVVSFSTDRGSQGGGWGQPGGGSNERASRICWREAQAAGFPVRSVLSVRPADRNGRLVILRSGHNNEVHCLYRNGVRDLRYRRR